MNGQLWRIFENEVVDGRYHLNRLLGAGQFGGVYLANEGIGDRWLRQVAVKLVERSPGKDGDRQWREVQASQFEHPGLLRILTTGFCQLQINQKFFDFLYLVTDLAQESLSDCLERGPLLPDETREMVLSLADALVFLHGQSPALVHRDIKPANIFKVNGVWKLGDFGLLRIANKGNDPTFTDGFGTPAYAAPESYENRVIPLWDMWSLGMVLVESLTGRLPFTFETPEAWQKEVTNRDKEVPVPSLPEPFFSIARGCLEKDEIKRWSALSVVDTLRSNAGASKLSLKLNSSLITKKNTWQCPVTGMEFLFVPGGIFKMGNVFGEGSQDENPVHEVRVGNFWMGKYPVTQGQWVRVMGTNSSFFKKGDNYPVETVSWNDAQEFIKKLNEHKNEQFYLPTEAEWEYAARSGGKREIYSGGDNIDRVAWYKGNSDDSTQPVGQKAANGLGLYDMSGNVWEWVRDWYDGNYYVNSHKDNPRGPWGGYNRVIRGGSWRIDPSYVRSTYRLSTDPANRNNNLGFRLAKPANAFASPMPKSRWPGNWG